MPATSLVAIFESESRMLSALPHHSRHGLHCFLNTMLLLPQQPLRSGSVGEPQTDCSDRGINTGCLEHKDRVFQAIWCIVAVIVSLVMQYQ